MLILFKLIIKGITIKFWYAQIFSVIFVSL